MITCLGIAGYRSLRDLRLALHPLTVVTGTNGSGKSSLYRALRLLADAAQGRIVPSLALEGGLSSALWAGPEAFSRGMKQGEAPVQGGVRRTPVSLKLGFSGPEYGYAIDLGLPPPVPPSRFDRDPEIKLESLWTGELLRRSSVFAERAGPAVRIRDRQGAWQPVVQDLEPYHSMLTHGSDPREAAELLVMRERMRDWRFYDHFRTDAASPARQRQVGTRTPVLAGDGADLAAAIVTIQEVGDDAALDAVVADAFPGGAVTVAGSDGWLELEMRQHGLLRPLRASELSEGTLRYLLLAAALLSPRPPELMVLNEPEASLHPDLLAPLARLVAHAARRSQVVVVSHAERLVAALQAAGGVRVTLAKRLGETLADDGDPPAWQWPSR